MQYRTFINFHHMVLKSGDYVCNCKISLLNMLKFVLIHSKKLHFFRVISILQYTTTAQNLNLSIKVPQPIKSTMVLILN